MFRNQLIPFAMATVVALGATVSLASAATNDNAQEMAALSTAKISLGQAVAAAEQKVGGRAIDAGLNNENGTMTYGVEVIKGTAVRTVLIDINSGEVVKILPADAEAETNNEQNGQESGD